MFFPMSWMSPFTVAKMIVPRDVPFWPVCSMWARICENAFFAASAAINNCGRNIVLFSKHFPT